LLVNGLVKAVEQKGEKYKLVDSPRNVARRLGGLGLSFADLVVRGDGSD
jgi:hypothetical protein